MDVKLSGSFGYVETVLEEFVNGNKSLFIEIVRGLAAEDLLYELYAITSLSPKKIFPTSSAIRASL